MARSTFTVAINRRWKDQLACCVSRRVRATSFDAALCALKPASEVPDDLNQGITDDDVPF